MLNARSAGKIIPSFGVSYLPMMEPIINAIRDTNSFAQVAVAQVDWQQFGAVSLRATYEEYQKFKDERFTRLHLDHVPVVDEQDGQAVDYESIIAEAVQLGYDSVMVDGSFLNLNDNIAATRKITDLAHSAGIAVEAEIGAVSGYFGMSMPYEELFASRKGFTDIQQARQMAEETGADWLSVAIGNIHGALTAGKRNQEKVTARLDIEHLRKIYDAVNIPLVLHGGSGIQREYIQNAMRNGIAKINVATAVRQPFEAGRKDSIAAAQQAVYDAACRVLAEELEMADSADVINPQA